MNVYPETMPACQLGVGLWEQLPKVKSKRHLGATWELPVDDLAPQFGALSFGG